jgi:hypothetical protein
VVQHAPAVHDVEVAQAGEVACIQHRAFLDPPPGIVDRLAAGCGMAIAQRPRAGHRLRVVVERVHGGPEPPRRQAEQAAAGARIEQAQAGERSQAEHLLQRALGLQDALLVEVLQEARPVGTEAEALAGADLLRVRGRAGCGGEGIHAIVAPSSACARHASNISTGQSR